MKNFEEKTGDVTNLVWLCFKFDNKGTKIRAECFKFDNTYQNCTLSLQPVLREKIDTIENIKGMKAQCYLLRNEMRQLYIMTLMGAPLVLFNTLPLVVCVTLLLSLSLSLSLSRSEREQDEVRCSAQSERLHWKADPSSRRRRDPVGE
jgi:hypothetical protein